MFPATHDHPRACKSQLSRARHPSSVSHETDMLQPTHDRHQLFAPCTVRVHPLLCTRSLRPKTSGRTWRTTGKLFARWISSNSLFSHTPTATSGPRLSPARLCLQLACCSYRLLHASGLSSHAWQTYSALPSPSSHAPASPARLSSTYFSLYRTRRTAPAHDSFCSPMSCTTPATRKSGPCGNPLSREGTPRFGYK